MRTIFLFLFVFIVHLFSKAQAPLDVLQYNYQLTLSDASDTLNGTAEITARMLQNSNRFYLNLASVKQGKGMQVKTVTSGRGAFSFTHIRDTVLVTSATDFHKGDSLTFVITYVGVPADGLIISKNKYNQRTFFADNWPNRAHQWIPCNDRPDDKATVRFNVTAPSHYKVVSNGVLISEEKIDASQTRTIWQEATPVPSKVMVIGAARFAVTNFTDSSITPVSGWVYPQDSIRGAIDYSLATGIVRFFSNYIGPYPFEKLANVQSKTIFGGMENAGCIFYAENTVTGTRSPEALLAHEIAHQWFGNSATEKNFAHLWLSEGFATYLTHYYLEQKYGRDTLVTRLQEDRKEILLFAKRWPFPVVDSVSALMDLLNANSYQKGGWMLHMLRQEVGDVVFQKIIQSYYNRYKWSNADTWDFEKVAEEISGKNLKAFFQQWLFTPGIPQLHVQAQLGAQRVVLTITQRNGLYNVPLEVGLVSGDGKLTVQTVQVREKETTISIDQSNVKRIILDPNTKLLFEEVR